MKKYLSLLLAGVLVTCTLVGCGSNNENDELKQQIAALQEELDALKEETEEAIEEDTEEVTEEDTEKATIQAMATKDDTANDNTDVSADWKSYSFSVNGKTLTLPCSYAELAEATGFFMKSSDAKSYLEGSYYCGVNLYTGDDDLALYIDILNDTDEDAVYTDCKIVSISQTENQVYDYNAAPITFAGGLQVGQAMTTDELESIFGVPDDTYEYIDDDSEYPYEKYEWTYAEDPDWTTHNCFEVSIVNGVIDGIELEHLYYE